MKQISVDDAMHVVAGALNGDGIRWRECADYGAPDNTFEWYYAENNLIVIRHKRLKSINFIRTKSPADAFNKLKGLYLS